MVLHFYLPICLSQNPICLFVIHPYQEKKACKLHSTANGFINFHLVLPWHFKSIWFESTVVPRSYAIFAATLFWIGSKKIRVKLFSSQLCYFFFPQLRYFLLFFAQIRYFFLFPPQLSYFLHTWCPIYESLKGKIL